ncbi:hypothetical protein, partial [uncultured Deinococcus sp.]|uniref:hypothetical protein n=1 Tax=uncultured Deinococcus sp. TaxID=158789 RepID=UPI0037484313
MSLPEILAPAQKKRTGNIPGPLFLRWGQDFGQAHLERPLGVQKTRNMEAFQGLDCDMRGESLRRGGALKTGG